jgi:hypothetical protein
MEDYLLKNISVPDHFMQRGMSNQRNEQISMARTSAVMLSALFLRLTDNTLSMYKGTDDSSKEFAAYFFICRSDVQIVCGLVYAHI